jgi:hypothetical protein
VARWRKLYTFSPEIEGAPVLYHLESYEDRRVLRQIYSDDSLQEIAEIMHRWGRLEMVRNAIENNPHIEITEPIKMIQLSDDKNQFRCEFSAALKDPINDIRINLLGDTE